MTDAGYAVVSLDYLPWTRHGGTTAWASLTAALGATDTEVDAVRLGAGETVELAADPEQLLVPLEGKLALGGVDGPLGHPGLGRVPAGVGATLEGLEAGTSIVVQVEAAPEPEASPVAVDLEAVEYVVPETSEIATAFLTGPLGSVGLKVNARRLGPGQVVPYHTEGDQEELFVPLEGPASLRVDDERYPLPVGSVARVAPPVPRSAVNDGAADALWVMVGAPPTGEDDWWDPGAEILE